MSECRAPPLAGRVRIACRRPCGVGVRPGACRRVGERAAGRERHSARRSVPVRATRRFLRVGVSPPARAVRLRASARPAARDDGGARRASGGGDKIRPLERRAARPGHPRRAPRTAARIFIDSSVGRAQACALSSARRRRVARARSLARRRVGEEKRPLRRSARLGAPRPLARIGTCFVGSSARAATLVRASPPSSRQRQQHRRRVASARRGGLCARTFLVGRNGELVTTLFFRARCVGVARRRWPASSRHSPAPATHMHVRCRRQRNSAARRGAARPTLLVGRVASTSRDALCFRFSRLRRARHVVRSAPPAVALTAAGVSSARAVLCHRSRPFVACRRRATTSPARVPGARRSSLLASSSCDLFTPRPSAARPSSAWRAFALGCNFAAVRVNFLAQLPLRVVAGFRSGQFCRRVASASVSCSTLTLPTLFFCFASLVNFGNE